MPTFNKVKLWTALVTPFKEDLSIDYESMERLLLEQKNANNGILLFGSTGEGLALTSEEKKTVVKFVCSLKLELPLMVGIGGFQLPTIIEGLSFCETLPIDAYLMVTPIYAKPGAKGQIEWFKALMDKVSRPCLLYHIPSRAGCPLLVTAVRELKNHPRFWGIKDSGGSLNDFYAFLDAASEAAMYCGDDGMMPYFSVAGAVGLISVMSNAWPLATKNYVALCLEKKLEPLSFWHKASSAFFTSSNPGPLKALLHHKGWIQTPYMRPPLSHGDVSDINILREADVLLKEKIHQHTLYQLLVK